jgi:hypothetical protein
MKAKTVFPVFLIALLVASSMLVVSEASTVNYIATFESGWDGWEGVGGSSSYQRGTSYAHSGSYSVYTSAGKVIDLGPHQDYTENAYYHVRKTFVWRGVVLLSAWYRPVGKTSNTGMSYILFFANGTYIHGAWLASSEGNWVQGAQNLTDEVEDQEGYELEGQTVMLTLFTEWYDSGTETLYSGYGAIDDINITCITTETEQDEGGVPIPYPPPPYEPPPPQNESQSQGEGGAAQFYGRFVETVKEVVRRLLGNPLYLLLFLLMVAVLAYYSTRKRPRR